MKVRVIGLMLVLNICFSHIEANGQQPPAEASANLEIGEMIRIYTTYLSYPYLSFEMQTVISDSAGVCCDTIGGNQADTVGGIYRVHDGRYWAMIDSVEYLQGFMYSLALYHEDKIIAVGKPSVDNRILPMSLLDSAFQDNYITSTVLSNVSTSIRNLKIEFSSEYPYSSLEVKYDKNTYLPREVTYYLKRGYVRADETLATAKVRTTFFNESTAEFNLEYFLEEKYIYKDRDGFKVKPTYSDYQIMLTDTEL